MALAVVLRGGEMLADALRGPEWREAGRERGLTSG